MSRPRLPKRLRFMSLGLLLGELPWRVPKHPYVLAVRGTAWLWAPAAFLLGLIGLRKSKNILPLALGVATPAMARVLTKRGQRQAKWSSVAPFLLNPRLTTLRVATINMKVGNETPGLAATRLAMETPHIVLACECTEQNEKYLTAALGPPVARGDNGSATTLIYAPGLNGGEIVEREPVQCVGRVLARAEMKTSQGPMDIISVHLTAPRTKDGIKEWVEQHVQLPWWASSQKTQFMLMGGDFNTSILFKELSYYKKVDLKNAAQSHGRGGLLTWGPHPKTPMLNLDHIYTRGLRVLSLKAIEVPGSDHKALVADFII